MPFFETKYFGCLSYDPESAVEFPCGLPGFEDCRKFVVVRLPQSDPLIYLQSLEDPGLCFITMPVLSVDPEYRLRVSDEDLDLLGLSSARQPRIGDDVLCLTVVSMKEDGPTANLLAPVVVNVRSLKAVQAISPDSRYSHQHALLPQEIAVC
jgi:flagellar assembly factor FliW